MVFRGRPRPLFNVCVFWREVARTEIVPQPALVGTQSIRYHSLTLVDFLPPACPRICFHSRLDFFLPLPHPPPPKKKISKKQVTQNNYT